MDKEQIKSKLCELIDNIPEAVEITDLYLEHGYYAKEAILKLVIKPKEETMENIKSFHNVAHNSFNTDIDLLS